MTSQVNAEAIALLSGLLTDPVTLKKRVGDYSGLFNEVLAAEAGLEMRTAEFSAHESRVKAELARAQRHLANRRDLVAGEEGRNEATREWLEQRETEWAGCGLPSEIPGRQEEESTDAA
jgi:hypothetical protein